jgi:RNA polymerase sigma-70 factor, ECF subfamily
MPSTHFSTIAQHRFPIAASAVCAAVADSHRTLKRRERALFLANAMEQLPEAQREALVSRHWHGWSLAEIGELMNRTPVAVSGLLKRGLFALRTRLTEVE